MPAFISSFYHEVVDNKFILCYTNVVIRWKRPYTGGFSHRIYIRDSKRWVNIIKHNRKAKIMKNMKKIVTALSLCLALSLPGFTSLAADETAPADTAVSSRYATEPATCLKCGENQCGRREVSRTLISSYYDPDEEMYEQKFFLTDAPPQRARPFDCKHNTCE